MVRAYRHILILAALVIASWACAQEDLRIYQISTKPVMQEAGRAWDIQVRFLTSEPAVVTMDHGDADTCPITVGPTVYWDVKTDEPLRNHRFDITDLEAVTEVIEVQPPAKFPRGNVERQVISLTVAETEGVKRDEPVTFGIPLPEGAIGRTSMATLTDGGTPIPIATRALLRWPDGSIKWLLVSGRSAPRSRRR